MLIWNSQHSIAWIVMCTLLSDITASTQLPKHYTTKSMTTPVLYVHVCL